MSTNERKPYKLAVMVGRYSIPTLAHEHLLRMAHEKADKVLVIMGSANASCSARNPFPASVRQDLFRSSLHGTTLFNTAFDQVDDFPYDFHWVSAVSKVVQTHMARFDIIDMSEVCFTGSTKDDSTYYTTSFYPAGSELIAPMGQLSATDAREAWLYRNDLTRFCSAKVIDALAAWTEKHSKAFLWLIDNEVACKRFKLPYAKLPYGINFTTGDALVICGKYFLTIKRREMPGKGQRALPGGFVNQGDTVIETIFKGLAEETLIDVTKEELKAAFRGTEYFDTPNRDPRSSGFFTHCGVFILQSRSDGSLPEVTGQDDAEDARWDELCHLPELKSEMYADHGHIVDICFNKYAITR